MKEIFGSDEEKILVQSMTDTKTYDRESTLAQVKSLLDVGCDIVRISTPSLDEIESFNQIVKELRKLGHTQKIVADIHFNPKLALEASKYADKVRINPGNFLSREDNLLDHEAKRDIIFNELKPLVVQCKKNNTALRVGINQGSVYKGASSVYDVEELVDQSIEYLSILRSLDFVNVVVSIKSSDPFVMIEANELLQKALLVRDWNYPIHLGVTEAGNGIEARVKSSFGIGSLLLKNIGNTIRVSLTEPPIHEIEMAQSIIQLVKNNGDVILPTNQLANRVKMISLQDSFYKNPILINDSEFEATHKWNGDFKIQQFPSDVCQLVSWNEEINLNDVKTSDHNIYFVVRYNDLRDIFKQFISVNKRWPILLLSELNSLRDEQIAKSSLEITNLIRTNVIHGVVAKSDGQEEVNFHMELMTEIFQISGKRNLKSTVVACPGCSRSNIDLQKITSDLKEEFGHLKNRHFSVMGCSVNGYGEMLNSNIGIIGKGMGKVDVYFEQELIFANIAEEQVLHKIEELLFVKESEVV